MANEHDKQQEKQQNTKKENNMLDENFKISDSNSSKETENDENLELSKGCKGKMNDLVADLCINGGRSCGQTTQNMGAYGDYKNIRATAGPVGLNESNINTNSSVENSNPINNVQQQAPTQNSSFSFKHFLSNNTVPTAPSTTVTSLDPPVKSTSTTSSSNATTSSRSLQSSTGARPKVPQSNSVSSTSISSLTVGNANDTLTSLTKMKRSPRFSSFDSQASLAEYVGSTTTADLPSAEATAACCSTESNDCNLLERDHFEEWNLPSNASTITTNSTDYDRAYVPRSYSNYDMPRPQTSPRRRVGIGATTKDTRPTRLALNTNPTTAAKLKLDLPLTSNSTGGSGSNVVGVSVSSRKTAHCSRPSDFPILNPVPGAVSAAVLLPDFVQDHWMDAWYASDMHVNSPPSSPINNFMDDLNVEGASGVSGNMGVIHAHNSSIRTLQSDNGPLPDPADRENFNMGLPEQSSSVGSKMLPDFLSDGPIIHSSQRLADVAAGLPSNSIGSPEESSINNQLSRLRLDNERLHRDLNEARLALNEQTLRANNLERQLFEQQRLHETQADETLDTNKKRTVAVQTQVAKLKQQVQQLTAEVEILRREKELVREEGAVGGCTVRSCDTTFAAGTVSSKALNTSETTSVNDTEIGGSSSVNSVPGAGGGGGGKILLGIRPSRQHQLSRDLRRAASNAENNLKQLLAGVENLRQMAANIEKSDTRVDYDASPDLFSDFLDECDDYNEYSGAGPAL